MTHDIDHLGRQAASQLRASVADVQPRNLSAMADRRRRMVSVAFASCAVVLAAGAFALVRVSSSSSASPTLLPATANPPAGISTKQFSPTDLGASLTLPATWVAAPPASGFKYVMSDPGKKAFLLAGLIARTTTLSPSAVAQDRTAFLTSRGAHITATTTGTVEGRPATRLSYRLPAAGTTRAVDDVEYDILLGERGDVIIVLGQAAPATPSPLFAWIASTIRIAP